MSHSQIDLSNTVERNRALSNIVERDRSKSSAFEHRRSSTDRIQTQSDHTLKPTSALATIRDACSIDIERYRTKSSAIEHPQPQNSHDLRVVNRLPNDTISVNDRTPNLRRSTMNNRFLTLSAALSIAVSSNLFAGTTIWKEAEQPTQQQVERHPWWYDKVQANQLSGGQWMSHYSETKTGSLTYQFGIPAAGKYSFWLRANPVGSKMTYSINDGPAQDINFQGALDQKNVADDQAMDHRFIGWVNLGQLDLKPGKFKVQFTIAGGVNNSGALDCFVLTTEPFKPVGFARPGQADTKPPEAMMSDATSWPFEPPADTFKDDALLDLRSLNEKVAGETGFVQLSADGNSFTKGDGTPIRFWAVVTDAWNKPEAHQREHARWLAKLGVNMVRLHTDISNTKEGSDINSVNDEAINNIQRFVSICKENGIYVTISPWWAHATVPESWGIEGYAGAQPWGVMFYNTKLQDAYKNWVRQLYTRPNPYANGTPLKDEPAVAIVQVKNEDSLLFFTFQGTKPEQLRVIGKQFFDFAVSKYGSIEKAQAAWDNASVETDDVANGILGFNLIWDLFQPQNTGVASGKNRRMTDQTEFLVKVQHDFYSGIDKFYKQELGIKQLTNAMNWKSADPVLLDDAERLGYTAMDVSAVNYYVDGLHIGENNGYRIDPGHKIQDRSVLRGEMGFSGALKQTVGHPMLITETAWVNPNLYQSEGPFLMAAYQSLSGVDAAYWFAHGGKPTWETDPRAMFWPVGESHATFKWFGNFYGQAAQFPAYAIAFRNGYIEEAKEPAVYEERSLADIFQRTTPIIAESGRFDPNRDTGSFAPDSPVKSDISRDAFFVGPVVVKFGGDAKNNKAVDLQKFIDSTTGDIRSLTGQLTLNTKKGIATINASKIQGVSGFLKSAGGSFKLADLTITSSNDYATIAAVSLDGAELKTSKRVLIQIGTTAKLTGFSTRKETFEQDGKTIEGEIIENNGTPPYRVENTRATITLNNPSLSKATLLDPSGYKVRGVVLRQNEARRSQERSAGWCSLTIENNPTSTDRRPDQAPPIGRVLLLVVLN
jgi:Cellulase (glycosyl hydrolase family 5)